MNFFDIILIEKLAEHIIHHKSTIVNQLCMGESVLKTGILPVPIWKNDEKGVILSALCVEGDRRSSVHLPVIRNGKTSEMYVEYKYVSISHKSSIPVISGKAVNPIQYTDELCKGFAGAYKLYTQKKETADLLICPLFETDMRYLTIKSIIYCMATRGLWLC